MPEQTSRTICEICGGMHPTSEHPQNADEKEEMKDLEQRQSEYMEKIRKAFKLTPESADYNYNKIKLQKLAEHDARLIAIARVESDYMGKKIKEMYQETFYRKKKELLEPLGLHIYKGQNEYEAYDVLEYNGKKLDGVYKYLSDPKSLFDDLKADASREIYRGQAEHRRKAAQQFQTDFDALPEEVQNAAKEWVRWDTNIDRVGKTLDVMLEAGRIKRDAYDEIRKAHAEGKKIIHNIIDPDIGRRKLGQRYGRRYHYWAIVDQSDQNNRPTERTTNIGPEGLNYDQETYTAEEYEDDIRRSIPGYEELHQRIEDIATEYSTDHEVESMLDLGVGTRLTAERLLKIMPNASLTAVDRFENENMQKGAEKRLADAKVTFLKGDYSEIDFGKNYEIIESVIGIHHQTHNGKRKLFKKVFDALKPGGIFIFGDLVTYKDEKKAKENEEKHFQFLRENARDEQSLREWEKHHREDNLLAPIEDQIEWLKEAGFSEVEVKFEHLNTALIIARK